MAFNVRHPVWLSQVPAPGIRVFATLYGIEAIARATTVSIIPIQAYDLLGDAQSVSFLYSLAALAGLVSGFAVPVLIRRVSRRWTYTIGCMMLVICAAALATVTLPGQVFGMLCRTFGSAALNITLSLYIMDYIRKHDYVRNDSVRLAASTVGWMVAPFLGVWLYENVGHSIAFIWSAVCALILVLVFWYFRLSDKPQISPARMRPVNPLLHIRRFVSQPRLRMAWLIAFGRSSFWSMLFIYAPLLMVTGGEGSAAGGLVVSLSNAVLFSVLIWARVERRIKLRRTITIGFVGVAVLLLASGFAGEANPWIAAGFLIFASVFASALDAAGTAPYFRSVRFHERADMTAVYRTYLDLGELIPPIIFGILLGFFSLSAVFISLSVFQFICAALVWRNLHPRL